MCFINCSQLYSYLLNLYHLQRIQCSYKYALWKPRKYYDVDFKYNTLKNFHNQYYIDPILDRV